MTENKMHKDKNDKDKLSARMSIFSWILCAVLGWAVALTTLNSLITTTSDNPKEATITAKNSAIYEEAEKLENIQPAAGKIN